MSILLNNLPQGEKKNRNSEKSKSGSSIGRLLNTEISLGKRKYSDKKKEHFFSEMSMLLEAGVDIRTALEIVQEEQIKPKDIELIKNIYNSLIKGNSLSEAIEESCYFGLYEIYSVKIGEETGQLAKVLQQLSAYYKSRLEFKRKLVNALSYPLVVLFTAILVVIFMLNFVVPMFSEIFRQSNTELPGITLAVIKVSGFFREYILLFLTAIILLIILFQRVKKQELFRKITSVNLLKVKYLGSVIRLNYLFQYCKSLALLTESGLPLLRSIQLLQKMIVYYPMEQDLLHIEQELLKGKTFAESLMSTLLFDKKTVSLTRLAEEINQQAMVYNRLASQYEEELQQKMMLLSSVLEPLIILLVGILVAIILIAMYLPMFKMGGAIG